MKISEIDIDDITFAQRIQIGQIFDKKDQAEIDVCKRIFTEVFDVNWNLRTIPAIVKKWTDVQQGILGWINKEKELRYEPTIDEKKAGIANLNKMTGYMGVAMAIAKQFSTDPDVVLQWKYGKVFNILYVNKLNADYQKKYQQVIEQKNKLKNKRSWQNNLYNR